MKLHEPLTYRPHLGFSVEGFLRGIIAGRIETGLVVDAQGRVLQREEMIEVFEKLRFSGFEVWDTTGQCPNFHPKLGCRCLGELQKSAAVTY